MENPEEILQSLEEFSKLKPKDIPRELEDYLCFVAKTGDPVYQWSAVKSLFREKLLNVITDFYESCSSIDIPPCPNVDVFNYEVMKNFILEKLDTFAAAPFTVQRICELLTTPRKEYNRIDKYMRALEKNILVVSTTEPGNRRSTENGDGFVNGIENEHSFDMNSSNDINVEEMDDANWSHASETDSNSCENVNNKLSVEPQISPTEDVQQQFTSEPPADKPCIAKQEPEASNSTEESLFVSIEPVVSSTCSKQVDTEPDVTVTITAIPAAVQKRRDSIEPVVSSDVPNEQVSSTKDTSVLPETEQPTTTVSDKIENTEEPTEPETEVKVDEAPSLQTIEVTETTQSEETMQPIVEKTTELKKSDEHADAIESNPVEQNEASVAEEKEIPVDDNMDAEPLPENSKINAQEIDFTVKDTISSTTNEANDEPILVTDSENKSETLTENDNKNEEEEIPQATTTGDAISTEEEQLPTSEVSNTVEEEKVTPMEVDSEEPSTIISDPVQES